MFLREFQDSVAFTICLHPPCSGRLEIRRGGRGGGGTNLSVIWREASHRLSKLEGWDWTLCQDLTVTWFIRT
ncbi:hypothetical protein chiPu_0015088 [Chiloscyllium punctatum]|uniref:Uncharacterized protein n=1 Tax=Chiloscyllium punctatum TaxID=137246 RepID=A0A401T1R2_CHIPU|nr:hypothetical protein [Chiloscyllium punctatum]